MKFTLQDTTERYRTTLKAMEPGRIDKLGEGWAKAGLALFFGADVNRAGFSVRDTLVPMLSADNRALDNEIMLQLLASIKLQQSAGDIAGQIHDTYIASKRKG